MFKNLNHSHFFLIAIICLYFFYCNPIESQTLMGYHGLIRIPTSAKINDGKLSIGTFFINKEIAVLEKNITNNVRNTISLNYLPFLEIDLILNNLINSDSPEQAIGDRQTNFKLTLPQIIDLPRIGIGFYDMIGSLENSGVHSDYIYLVATKEFYMNDITFSPSIGYAHYVYHEINSGLNGLFYGLSINYSNYIELLAEYDSKYYNLGTRFSLFSKVNFLVTLIDMKHFSGGFAFKFSL